MSSLTRLIEDAIKNISLYPSGTVGAINASSQFARCCREAVPAHDAEIRAQAKREQMEADLELACNVVRENEFISAKHKDRIVIAICYAFAKAPYEEAIKEAKGE